MQKLLFLIISSFLLTSLSCAQEIEWQNTIGGSGWDELHSVIQTNDGGSLIGGYSNSNISGDKTENCMGDYDYWIVKIDSLVISSGKTRLVEIIMII